MSIENPTEDVRLNEEEAQNEANMLRASMRMNPESGKLLRTKTEMRDGRYNSENPYATYKVNPEDFIEKGATRKDYEVAQKMLDELEKFAEKDPELLVKLTQYAQASFLGAFIPFIIIGAIAETASGFIHESKDIPTEIENELRGISLETSFDLQQIFSDARSRLERLKKKGEEFAEKS